ncbi:MAG: right-handed parallel beta-helix repeat-containing protein [Sedimentisphaerales bacterium]|nr:right-handed parallel beta-helix repeat-containing protein [Sedimentisphaerales bacterium]
MRGKDYLLFWPVFVLCVMATVSTAKAGEIIYVDDDAVGANNGSSWENAFTDLQDAIMMAQGGDEIRVAQGIYAPTREPLDRDATFDLKDGVSITGGYAGLAGMYPDFRHTKFFTTILSGDIDNNDDITDPNSKEGNSRHVVTCIGEGNTPVLEGVTITGGYSNETGIHGNTGAGGGLYCRNECSPQLIDCVFTNNYAGVGGAVYISASYPMFTYCVWEDNYAGGGNVYVSGESNPVFKNCLFENNIVECNGGAINVSRSAYLISLNSCVFRRNSAGRRGGAIYTDIMGEVRMVNCLFVANTAGDLGGAISCLDHNDGTGHSLYNLVNCTFYGNTSPTFDSPPANTERQPDGLRVYWSDSVITNCIFYNSVANGPSDIPVSFKFGVKEPLIITCIYEEELSQDGVVPPIPNHLFMDPCGADGILGTEDDNFHLAPCSPAIDSGTNQTDPLLPPMDLDGNPRIINDIVDLGAYESIDKIVP